MTFIKQESIKQGPKQIIQAMCVEWTNEQMIM